MMLAFDLKRPLYGFRTKCGHAWRHVHLFRDEQDGFVCFRPRCAPGDWLGTFQGDFYASWSQDERNWKRVERVIRPHLEQGHIWRVFYLPDPREGERRAWRISWRPDYGYAKPLDGNTELEGAYFWPRSAKFNVWKTPTSVLKRHFETEWRDPQSDVRAALPWCDLSHEERDVRAISWKRGNLQELEQLTLAALRFTSFTNDALSPDSVYPIHVWLFWDENGQYIQPTLHWDVKMNPGMKCWRRLSRRINDHHQGTYNLPNGSRNDWIFPWIDYEPPRSSRRSAMVELDVSHPTQHERLEATLYLRDWLTANAPDLLSDWF